MNARKTILISTLLLIAFVVTGCGTAHVQRDDSAGLSRDLVTWRPTGTGFYYAEQQYHRPSGE